MDIHLRDFWVVTGCSVTNVRGVTTQKTVSWMFIAVNITRNMSHTGPNVILL